MLNFERILKPRAKWLGSSALVSTALTLMGLTVTVIQPAMAQDATWQLNPGSFDFNTAANWSPAVVPTDTGTAFFGVSNTTDLGFSLPITRSGRWVFNAGASNYNLFMGDQAITFYGAGIVINGGSATLIKYGSSGSLNFNNSSSAGSATIKNDTGNLNFNNTSTAGSATISNDGFGSFVNFNNSSSASSATITNNSFLRFSNQSTAGNSTITNGFAMFFLGSSTAGSATITNNADLIFNASSTAGNATITNTGSLQIYSTAGNAIIHNSGSIYFSGTASNATIDNSGAGDLGFYVNATAGSATITTNSGARTSLFDTATGGTARFILNGSGALDVSGLTTGGAAAGSIEGGGTVFLGAKNLAVGGNYLSTTFSGLIQDGGLSGGVGGSLTKTGTGTLTLSSTNTFTGTTAVNAGTLQVDGSIASSSLTSVNNGGTLSGNGTVGNTAINNGGTLAPGNSTAVLTVQGSLTFSTAAAYLVQTSGASSSSRTVVTGNADLAGQVVVNPQARLLQSTTYKIMTTGSHTGAFAGASLQAGNYFGSNPLLSYVGPDVFVTLGPGLLSLILPANAGVNHKNVAGAVDNALLAGVSPSTAFGAIFALTGNNLLNGLTQVSGETATGSQQTTFNAMTQFMGLMTDPFSAGRANGANAPGFAAEEDSAASAYASRGKRSKGEREAYAAIYSKAPIAKTYDPRWSVWAAGFGGSQTTDGNTALGSNNTTSRIFGVAAGADYFFSPNTVAGFALAGGGTSFSVFNGGSGRSDLFQAGGFIRHTAGAAYVTGALAYGWQDVTTDRTVTIAGIDRLRAQFNANAFSGRAEGGYRFVAPWIGGVGITPYAAGQFTTFELPAYTEQVVSGANTFALAYAAKSVTATRSELGFRTDKSFALQTAVLTLRGRAAWAHDFNPDRAVGATFQTLPGASFVVNGARQASDSALTTASAEIRWMNGFSLIGTFEGEFSNVTRSYAGKGVVRYTW